MDWQALFLSLRLATVCSLILFTLGMPLAYLLSQSDRLWVGLLEALFSLPLVLPPTVLGFYLLLIFGPLKLAFSFSGLVLASSLASLPFAFQAYLSAFRLIDKGFYETSWSLGESRARTFLRVALPLAKDGLVAGTILAFGHTMGEFGVVLMIGGNIPGVSRTLAISLYDQVEAFDYVSANRTAVVLILFSLITLVFVGGVRQRLRIR